MLFRYSEALKSHITRMVEIDEALHPCVDAGEVVSEQTQAISESVVELNNSNNSMERQITSIQSMMHNLVPDYQDESENTSA